MVMGFDGDPDIAALQEQKALEICEKLGGKDLGSEPGEIVVGASLRLLLSAAEPETPVDVWHDRDHRNL